MNDNHLPLTRVREILDEGGRQPILVLGDFMLDQFVWGKVSRISPEAPVPVVEFIRESYMPGGAANVARNLAALKNKVELIGPIGRDEAGRKLKSILQKEGVNVRGLFTRAGIPTSVKTRVVAQKQQMVRVDRETLGDLDDASAERILKRVRDSIHRCAAVVVGDYGKGTVTQPLLDELKGICRKAGVWLSMDPKPIHQLNLRGVSLITPNRKEAFELAGRTDQSSSSHPLENKSLLAMASSLMRKLKPALLLITLGDQGMLLCGRGKKPFHIPTFALDVFDVSGAGDTVIASFTMAIAAGASPVEAAIFSNHAAGIVVGKIGTATVTPAELLKHFRQTAQD